MNNEAGGRVRETNRANGGRPHSEHGRGGTGKDPGTWHGRGAAAAQGKKRRVYPYRPGKSPRVFKKGPFLSPFRIGGRHEAGGCVRQAGGGMGWACYKGCRYKRFMLQPKIKRTMTREAPPSPAVFGLIFPLIHALGRRPGTSSRRVHG